MASTSSVACFKLHSDFFVGVISVGVPTTHAKNNTNKAKITMNVTATQGNPCDIAITAAMNDPKIDEISSPTIYLSSHSQGI